MEDNLRRLNFLLKIFGHENFYSCTFCESNVVAQGKYSSKIVLLCKKLRFSHTLNTNGYTNFERYNYRIVLTD